MTQKIFLIVFTLLMLLFFTPSLTIAQTYNNDSKVSPEDSKEKTIFLKGRIKSINGNMIELGGGGPLIDISNIETIIAIEGFFRFPVSVLQPGVFIKKATVIAPEGQTFVQAIEIETESPSTTVITGTVQNVDLNNLTFTVANQLIVIKPGVTAFVDLKPPTSEPGLSRLKPGKLVKVATQVKDGETFAVLVSLDKKIIRAHNFQTLVPTTNLIKFNEKKD